MLPIRVGWLFCGLALGYALAVLHRGRVDKYNQHTTESAARVAKRVAAIGKRGTARHPFPNRRVRNLLAVDLFILLTAPLGGRSITQRRKERGSSELWAGIFVRK